MRLKTFIILALFTLPLAAAGGSDPCVPEGQTKDVQFDLPEPGDDGTHGPDGQHGPVSGGPGFQWVNKPGHHTSAFEKDPISDDPMGDVVPDQDSVSVPIKNDGGDLSGPNGDVQNGLEEGGDCIEVYVTASYRVWEKMRVTTTGHIHPEGIGVSGSETLEFWGWHYDSYTTKEKKVCPC